MHNMKESSEHLLALVNLSLIHILMENELKAIDGIMLNPQRPFCAILGGSKVSTKITIIENLLEKDVYKRQPLGPAISAMFSL